MGSQREQQRDRERTKDDYSETASSYGSTVASYSQDEPKAVWTKAPAHRMTMVYILSFLAGALAFLMMIFWIGLDQGGLGWYAHPNTMFNWHPLLMTGGMIFLNGQSIMFYRIFRHRYSHKSTKYFHAIFNFLTFGLMVVALHAVFWSLRHPRKVWYVNGTRYSTPTTPAPALDDVHGWMGMTTVLLFSAQFVLGFLSFLYPQANLSMRKWYRPVHRFFGLTIFILACCTACAGMSIIQAPGWHRPGVLCKIFVLAVILYAASVAYIVGNSAFKMGRTLEEREFLYEDLDKSRMRDEEQRARQHAR